MRYFKDENGPQGGSHKYEFWLFSNTKMNISNSLSGKSRQKK